MFRCMHSEKLLVATTSYFFTLIVVFVFSFHSTSWSKAGASLYRNEIFIDGYPGRSTYKKAQDAKQEIEDLVFICSWYKQQNEDLIICIENPKGYLQKHPVSEPFTSVLGLQRLRISYCKFSTPFSPLPRKNTIIWLVFESASFE